MKTKYFKDDSRVNARQKRVIMYDASGNARSTFIAMGIKKDRLYNLCPMNRYCYEVLLSKILVDPVITREFFMRLGKRNGVKMDKTSEFFLKEAAKIFTDVVTTLIKAAEDIGEEPCFGLWELTNICLDIEHLAAVLNTYPYIGRKYKSLLSGSAQNEGVFGSLSEVLEPMLPFANAYKQARDEGRVYDLNNFRRSNHILLLTRNDERGGDALNLLYGLIINTLITMIIGQHTDGRTKPASTYLIADEFQNLGFMNAILLIAAEGGRYGVCLMLATQAYGRVRDIWGEGNVQALIGNITRLVSLKVGDNDTATFMSNIFGNTTVERTVVSQAKEVSTSQQTVTEPLFTQGQFLNLPKLSKVAKTPMGAIVKCDGKLFKTSFPFKDLLDMLPPEASDELKAQDVSPQSKEIFFPNPLTDDDFIRLGLPHLIELPEDNEDESDDSEG